MKERFKKLTHNFKHDNYCYISVLFSVFFLIFHCVQFYKSGFMIEPLIRVIYCAAYPIVIFFLGRRAITFSFLIFALTIEQFTDFSNYTAFFIITIFILLNKRFTLPVLILYALDVFLVCEHHDKTVYHLIIHFGNCAFIYCVMHVLHYIEVRHIRANAVKLDLDESDREILRQLAAGAKHKEVEGYTENTVSKRLKKMRDRNYCETNQELLLRFLSEEK